MNKLLKGSIAGAAGIALLLGGAGTLAYWNSEAGLTGGSITSGTLSIAADGTATKVYEGTTTTAALIVPGDIVEVTQEVIIDATGDNLKAELTIDQTALVGENDLSDAVSIGLKAFAGVIEITDLTDLTAAEAASITSVVVTVTFPATVGDAVGDAVGEGEIAQDEAITLGDVKVLLTQIP